MSYVIESGKALRNRKPEWEIVDGAHDKDIAYRLMVSRALSLKAMYAPDGGRRLRVREATP